MSDKTKPSAESIDLAKAATGAPKWAALVDDEPMPMPQQRVKVLVIKEQAEVQAGFDLARDYESPHDVILKDEETIDLAEGNVFYSLECGSAVHGHGDAPPKLAFFVDDRPEISINPNQTGESIRQLFGLSNDVILIRDYESSHDETVASKDKAPFRKGPVFVTRRHHTKLKITVNNKPFTEAEGVKHRMTGRQIAALVSENPDATEVFKLKSGPQPQPIPLDQEIQIHDCDEFRVIRSNVAGGFEPSRVSRELKKLSDGGCRADLIQHPFPAVIYREVPTRPGYPHLAHTDVLVAIPNGYPGALIDGAYLPQGSPLIGRVAGSPQGTIQADGRTWQLISYHPHNGGGGPLWNKDRHGFHTYFDEVLCWIQKANN
jgi:hypothetical protein